MRVRYPAVVVLAAALSAGLAVGVAASAHGHTAAPKRAAVSSYVKSVAKKKTVDLKLIAGLAVSGETEFNFDGYENGKMTVTVPLGWTVDVAFSNAGELLHSAVIVSSAKRTALPVSAPAFKGASTPNPGVGTNIGGKSSFHFKATKAGKYAIVCGVPGHVGLGMWDNFVVKKGISKATITG